MKRLILVVLATSGLAGCFEAPSLDPAKLNTCDDCGDAAAKDSTEPIESDTRLDMEAPTDTKSDTAMDVGNTDGEVDLAMDAVSDVDLDLTPADAEPEMTAVCDATCTAPSACCNEVCSNLMSDPRNCGFCGNVCPGGACSMGVCTVGYEIPDWVEGECIDGDHQAISCPGSTQAFFGQDGQNMGPAARLTNTDSDHLFDENMRLYWSRNATELTLSGAQTHCSSQNFGGFDNWRLPTIPELVTLFNPTDIDGIDDAFSGLTGDGIVWSASRKNGDLPMHFVFKTGEAESDKLDTEALGVLCVSDGMQARVGVLTVAQNGKVVEDSRFGLEWLRTTEPAPVDWGGALAHCEGLNAYGHKDWHLPTYAQLYSIYTFGGVAPAVSPLFELVDGGHWTSTPGRISGAFSIRADSGRGVALGLADERRVICVRNR